MPNPDWWHVWKDVHIDPNATNYIEQGAKSIAPECVIDHFEGMCFGAALRVESMRHEDQGSLGNMMMAMVILMQLGVECNYTCFRQEVIAACSDGWPEVAFNREIFGELVHLMERAPYDDTVFKRFDRIRDGKDATGKEGSSRALLDHNRFPIDWYRIQAEDGVAMWLDAAEKTIVNDLRSGHQKFGRCIQ